MLVKYLPSLRFGRAALSICSFGRVGQLFSSVILPIHSFPWQSCRAPSPKEAPYGVCILFLSDISPHLVNVYGALQSGVPHYYYVYFGGRSGVRNVTFNVLGGCADVGNVKFHVGG